MKKNTVLSIISLLVCFLIGYAMFQATFLIRSWVLEKLGECKAVSEIPCGEQNQNLEIQHGRPQNFHAF